MINFVPAAYAVLLCFAALVSAATPSRMVAEYLPDYRMSKYNAKSINYTHVTHVLYAFAGISADGHVTLPSNFKQSVVDDIHAGKAKAILSVGGWGPFPFSTVFASPSLRAIFVADLKTVVNTYGLDGIDIDWEFPNRDVGAGLPTNSSDSANFLVGLKELRVALPAQASISVAVPVNGIVGPVQDVWLTDLSEFAAVIDHLTVMAYGLGGSWETFTGPNAPLQDTGVNFGGSVLFGINTLAAAKFPLNKIVLGTAFFGNTFVTTESMLNNAPTNQAATHNGAPTVFLTYSQITTYLQSLRVRDGSNPKFVSHFDTKTMTPWIFDSVTNTYTTYDNERSIAAKAVFAGCIGLKGVFAWEAAQDGNQLVPYLSEVNTLSTGTVSSSRLSATTTTSTVSTTATQTAVTTLTKTAAATTITATKTRTITSKPSTTTRPGRMIAEYLVDWEMSVYNAKSINYTHVTHVLYAFADINADGRLTLPSNFNQSVVDDIHAGNAKAILSVGGWGPFPFSPVFASPSLRAIFIKELTAAVNTYGLDGIDIDWEFPNKDAGAGLPTNSSDSANFLLGLNELRAALPSEVTVSATAAILGFIGPTPNVWMTDLSEFAAVLDFLTVMAYDFNGAWDPFTGPNAPLQDNGVNFGGSIVHGINFLSTTKFPFNKLVLGTAFYGRTYITTQSMLANAPTNQAATHNGAPTDFMTYAQIADYLQSLSVRDGNNPKFVSHFDTNTMTPWIYDSVSSKYITYDNERSIAAKATFAGCIGLKGVFSWEASQDGNLLVPHLSEVNTLSTGTIASCLELVLKGKVLSTTTTKQTTITIPSTTTTTATTKQPTTTTTTATTLKPTNTATATTKLPASTTSVGSDCYPAWSASATYNGGAKVSYQNINYIANWWAGSSDVPPAVAWKAVGPCGGSDSTTTTIITATKPATSSTTATTTTTKTTKSTTTSVQPTTTTTTTTTFKPTTKTTTTAIAATTTASSGGPVVGQPCSAGKSECSTGTMYFCLGSSWIVWYVGC
ncbi:glycosyl hydrolases family 18-domain-containing protein [Obelidium mucronatum]|nr:glycosyl hydrolases family 18-domain-containing protein [Obelidium mucronatum]